LTYIAPEISNFDEVVLVVIDQFEELFRYKERRSVDSRERRHDGQAAAEAYDFVQLLLAACQERGQVFIVITMRSDYLGDCAEFRDLPEALNECQYLVPRLTRDQRKQAIEYPLGATAISSALMQRMLNDAGDEADQLPVLQHALMRTWDHWQHDGRGEGPLSLSHYEAIGTMVHALDQHAEEVYAELRNERQQEICEKIFKALTDPGSDVRGIRRPTSLAMLCALADASSPEVVEVIDVFRKPSCSFLMPPWPELLEPDTVIDISHESLMRVWERLKVWVDEEAQSAQRYRRLSETAIEHSAGKAGLLRDPELQLSLDWSKSAKPNAAWASLYGGDFDGAIRFLAESEKDREKEKREKEERQRLELEQARALAAERAKAAHRLRIGIAIAVIFAVVAIATAMWALQQRAAAVAARKRAEQTTSLRLAAQARNEADLNREAAHDLLLARESILITQKIHAFSPTASRQLLDDVLTATGGIPLQYPGPVPALGITYSGPVASLGISSDGRWLAAGGAGGVQLWDMQAPFTAPVTLSGPDKVVNALAFSPNGHTLATVGDDASVHLWNMAAADRAGSARVLAARSGHLVDVAFSHNGRWLATASKDGAAQLWDLAAADPVAANSIVLHNGSVNTVAFSPDNHWLATGSSDRTIRMWDLLRTSPSEPIRVNQDVRKVAFSPNSQWLVAGDTESYTAVLMRVTAPDKPFLLKVNQWVGAVAFSPDGRWLATPSQYDARLWDLSKPDPSVEPLILPGHKNGIEDLAFSPDGQWFATGSADHTAQLWNVANHFSAPTVLRGHEGPISALAFSNDSRHLATVSLDRTVRLWNISSPDAEPLVLRAPDGSTGTRMWDTRAADLPAAPRILEVESDPAAGSVFSPDGQWLATIPSGDHVDSVHLWHLTTPSPTHYLVRQEGGIWASPAFSPDGRWLATGGVGDPTIRLWDLKASDPTSHPQVLSGHRGPVRSLAFSEDSKRLVTGANDGLALVWDLTAVNPSANPRRLAGGGGTSIVRTVAISSDGRYVATGSWEPDYAARIWDLSAPIASSRPITLTFKGRLFDVAFSPDGRWVAAGSWDFTSQLLDLSKPGTKPFVLKGHTARTLSVAFSPDSQWLATGNEDQTARLWNLAVADPSADSTVLHAVYKVGNVSFSPDGRWLALNPTEYRSSPFSPDGRWFASSSTDTRLYHLRLEDLMQLACRTAGRNLTKDEWRLFFEDQRYRKTCLELP
jgi:WD40 repeat protein